MMDLFCRRLLVGQSLDQPHHVPAGMQADRGELAGLEWVPQVDTYQLYMIFSRLGWLGRS